MSDDIIKKQDLLDWLNQYADSLLARGPMYGNFAEQEAMVHTLLSMRDFVLENSTKNHGHDAHYNVCLKYKLNPVFSFANQISGDQQYFSQILRDWWEYEY